MRFREDTHVMSSSCYCCRPATSSKAMDLDSALNELGMLSTVTESRLQYLREKDRRRRQENGTNRTQSCSLIEGEGSSVGTSVDQHKSPSKDSYHIIQINANFVTSLSSGPFVADVQASSGGISCGAKFTYSNLEFEAQMNRSKMTPKMPQFCKTKLSMRRFKKPYEVPWRLNLEKKLSSLTLDNDNNGGHTSNLRGVPATPKKSKINSGHYNKSNSSTPEKCLPPNEKRCTVTRSRSLDNLDFSKLQIAETENHNIIVQRREIDQMSEHFCGLQLDSHSAS